MRTYDIAANATTAAAPATVFDIIADTERWPSWALQDEASLESEGREVRQGVGAVRRMRTGRYLLREQVVEYEPGRRFGYVLLSGLPVKDYRADVTLEPAAAGTSIRWHSTFRAKIPGTGSMVRRRLQDIIQDTTDKLAAYAAAVEAGAQNES
jgi:uncharacterized protein YndB with AHSA1/START domain